MPKVTDLSHLFIELLKDVYYAEKKIYKTLPKLAKAVGKDSKLAEAFNHHREETEGQIQRLEQVFEMIQEKPKAKKCEAIEGILKEGDELIEEVEGKAALQAGLLSGAQAVEHYEMARYGTLIEWAKVLGHDDAVELLQETLDQEKATDKLLTEMAESEINQAAKDAMASEDEEEDATPMRKRA